MKSGKKITLFLPSLKGGGAERIWGEHLLSHLEQDEFLDSKPVRQRWIEHQSGRHNWRDSLWLVLMWQAWLQFVDDD